MKQVEVVKGKINKCQTCGNKKSYLFHNQNGHFWSKIKDECYGRFVKSVQEPSTIHKKKHLCQICFGKAVSPPPKVNWRVRKNAEK